MNQKSYDLVIVGGGLAGTAVATVMARAGADVLVLEREREFKDRVRGEFLAPWGLRELRELGLLDAFLEAGAITLPALAGRTLRPRPVLTPDGDPPLSFSHTAVQEATLIAAHEAGAEVVRGARVTEVQADDGGKVTFHTDEGPAEAAGRIVVGADGRTSLVRKALDQPVESWNTGRILAGVRLADVPADPTFGYFVIREEVGGLVSLFPQADGFARAYVFMEGTDASTYSGAGGFVRFMQAMQDLGIPADALAGARQAGPLAAFVSDDSWVNVPASGPLVVVGDAAGISDPTWGQGIALAFHDARGLTQELLRTDDWSDAVAQYALERQHYFNTVITAERWLTELQLTPGPEADARRTHVLSVWKRFPERGAGLDLPGRGPLLDTSEATRRLVFGEDIVRSDTTDEGLAADGEPIPHRPRRPTHSVADPAIATGPAPDRNVLLSA